MALSRARRDRGVDYWPGFVDALSTLILGIIFLLTVFVVVQFVLSQEVTGKDTALARLSARISQLTDLLGLEQTNKTSLEEQIAQLRANLATTDAERDKYKGMYEGLAGGNSAAQGQVSELTGKLDAEKQVSLRALAQVEVLNQQIAALRRQLSALEQALEVSEKKDKDSQSRLADLGQRLNVALALRFLRTAARNPGQPAGHPRGRRSFRAAIGGVLRHRTIDPQARGPRRARQ